MRWVVVLAFLSVAGLSYVYFKNQMQSTGNEIKNLESQLALLQTQDDVVRAQISKLSSRAYLQRRLAEGFIQMTPITDDRIVRVGGAHTAATGRTPTTGGEGLRRVSNRMTTP